MTQRLARSVLPSPGEIVLFQSTGSRRVRAVLAKQVLPKVDAPSRRAWSGWEEMTERFAK